MSAVHPSHLHGQLLDDQPFEHQKSYMPMSSIMEIIKSIQ